MRTVGVGKKLTRRALLRVGVGFGAVALVAGGGVRWLVSDRPTAPGRAALSLREAGVVAALADAYFPPGNPLGVSAADIDLVSAVDAYLASLLAEDRRLFRALLTAVDQWPRASLSSTSSFTAWPRADRVAKLRELDTSARAEPRLVGGLFRAMVGMPFLEDPRALAAIGHEPGCAL